MDSISKMLEGLDKVRNGTSNLPSTAYARRSYIDSISKQIGVVPDAKAKVPEGAMAAFAGMPVYQTDLLPKGVLCLLLDKDNKPVGQIVDETYVSQEHPSRESDNAK